MSPSRRTVLAGSGVGLTALFAGVFGRDRWEPGSSPYDWPMPRYDAAGTAHNPDASGPKSEPTVQWEVDREQSTGIEPEPSALIRTGTALYTTGRQLLGIDLDDGDVRFRHDGEYTTPPVRAHASQYETSTVAVGTRRGLLGCNASGGLRLFDRTLGTRRWLADDFATGEDRTSVMFTSQRRASRPVPRDGTVYTLTPSEQQTELIAVDPNDGSVRWRFQPQFPERSVFDPLVRPAIRDESLYLATSAGNVVAVATDGSTQRWERTLDVSETASPTATAAGLLVPHADGVTLLGYDGSIRWNRTLGDQSERATPAAATDETAAFVHGERLYAVGLERGTTLWTAGGFIQRPVIADGVVYTGELRHLVGFDLTTGEQQFEFEHSETLRGVLSPPVVGDGRLYCNSFRKTVALEEP